MVRLTDHLSMTIAVDWDVKPQTKQTNKTDAYPTHEINRSYRSASVLLKLFNNLRKRNKKQGCVKYFISFSQQVL